MKHCSLNSNFILIKQLQQTLKQDKPKKNDFKIYIIRRFLEQCLKNDTSITTLQEDVRWIRK